MNEIELYRIHRLEEHENQRRAELLRLAADDIRNRQATSRVKAVIRLTLLTLVISPLTVVVFLSRFLIST